MVGAASARTGSGSLFFFGRPPDSLPWTLRFFGGISCGREGIAGVSHAITAAVRPVARASGALAGAGLFAVADLEGRPAKAVPGGEAGGRDGSEAVYGVGGAWRRTCDAVTRANAASGP